MIYSSGYLYVVDHTDLYPPASPLRMVRRNSRPPTAAAGAQGIAADASGNLYVGQNGAISIVNISTQATQSFVGNGSSTSVPNDGNGTAARLSAAPYPLFDPVSGNIFFADSGSDLIREASTSFPLTVTTLAGQYASTGGPVASATASQARFNPVGPMVNDGTYLYAFDQLDIRKIDPTSGAVTSTSFSEPVARRLYQ